MGNAHERFDRRVLSRAAGFTAGVSAELPGIIRVRDSFID
jgi:hypothetical protein